ncbi:MAG: cytochrome c biogenesis protein ResB [Chromatiales bacterium]|nr:cytochrome c biogenesis protein ResB [Chromatiales bacterium]
MQDQTAQTARPHRSTASVLLEFLGSMNLAITLLVALAIASVIGTVLQQNQPYTGYLIKFGPFWHEIFRGLGLYDVYSAGWFMFILVFLVTSTSVCVWRHTPAMLRDMRHLRTKVQEKSLRGFQHQVEGEVQQAPKAYLAEAAAVFARQGYRTKIEDHGDHQVLAAMKGGASRLGYLLAHVAIVVICVGGMLDSKLSLRIAELAGQLKIETRNVPATEVPAISRLGSGNPSFRGSVEVPEGGAANVVFLSVRDGYLVQELPFRIEVKEFRVEHHSTGQPKSFESDLVIHDPDLPEPLERTIAVNHPLVHKGIAIYQASFGDGGSLLDLGIWMLDGRAVTPFTMQGRVFDSYPLETPDKTYRLELMNFSLFNVRPTPTDDGGTDLRNMGPSFTFRLREATGEAREYENYMTPVMQEGRLFFLSGVRESPAEPFRYLHLPAGPDGTPARFVTLLAYLNNPVIVDAVIEQTAAIAFDQATNADPEARAQIIASMKRLVGLFAAGGYEAIAREVETHTAPERVEEVAGIFIRVLHTALQGIYMQVLAEEGIDAPSEADQVFLEDAAITIGALPFYGSPFLFQLTGFEHVEASGLQIAKAPGQNVVYLGSLMLIVGIFLLFYVAQRRYWVWATPTATGTRALLAGSSNRNVMEFEQEFAGLSRRLLPADVARDAP